MIPNIVFFRTSYTRYCMKRTNHSSVNTENLGKNKPQLYHFSFGRYTRNTNLVAQTILPTVLSPLNKVLNLLYSRSEQQIQQGGPTSYLLPSLI
jgi:hypothetical protein